MSSSSDYRATLAHLYGRASGGIKLGLDAMHAVLDALGHPERRMRHVVVGGTNGKGSTSTFIAAALQKAGHRVGHYTSPHLLRFSERIRIDAQEIDADAVMRHYTTVCAHEPREPRPLSFFEATTAIALLAYAEAQVDVAVLEVGLGGRLDATNVVDRVLSVLTPIDLDHQHILGRSVAQIAEEKAGIIQVGVPVVVAPQQSEAATVFARVASERGAPLHWVEAHAEEPGGADWPPYLRKNLAVAKRACEVLDATGLRCPPEALRTAAAHARIAARYQYLEGKPPLLIDAGHNPAGLRALLAALADDPRLRRRPTHVVFSALGDRPIEEMAALLAPLAASLWSCPVPSSRSLTQAQLTARLPTAHVCASVAEALEGARTAARDDGGYVLVCGSIFLAGEVLALVTGAPRDPPVDG